MTDAWVGGHFEFVELAVLPEARGHGLGGRLHDVLLEGVPKERAMLSTDNGDSPAVRLYSARGWRKLGELDATPRSWVFSASRPTTAECSAYTANTSETCQSPLPQ